MPLVNPLTLKVLHLVHMALWENLKTLELSDVVSINCFLKPHANQYVLPLPGKLSNQISHAILFPSDKTKVDIYDLEYVQSDQVIFMFMNMYTFILIYNYMN